MTSKEYICSMLKEQGKTRGMVYPSQIEWITLWLVVVETIFRKKHASYEACAYREREGQ